MRIFLFAAIILFFSCQIKKQRLREKNNFYISTSFNKLRISEFYEKDEEDGWRDDERG